MPGAGLIKQRTQRVGEACGTQSPAPLWVTAQPDLYVCSGRFARPGWAGEAAAVRWVSLAVAWSRLRVSAKQSVIRREVCAALGQEKRRNAPSPVAPRRCRSVGQASPCCLQNSLHPSSLRIPPAARDDVYGLLQVRDVLQGRHHHGSRRHHLAHPSACGRGGVGVAHDECKGMGGTDRGQIKGIGVHMEG